MQGAGGLIGLMQSAALRPLMSRVVAAEVLDDLPNLKPVEAPPGTALTVLATEGLPAGLNLGAIDQAIHGWAPVRARNRAQPALTLGPEGMGLRLPVCLAEAEDIAAFADHAQLLADRLR